jgi:hypothetical protein
MYVFKCVDVQYVDVDRFFHRQADKEFEVISNKEGDCKMHTASYYMGGTLLAGRWVCCNQTDEDSIGCRNTTHISVEREWVHDPDYGTHTWKPA